MNKIFIWRRNGNATVTSNIFDILAEAGRYSGLEVCDNADRKQCINKGDKSDIYVVTYTKDVIDLWMHNRRKIFFWRQGITPEESYMRHHSMIRFWIISMQEYIALKCTRILAPVSIAMKEHYEKKYKMVINNSYILPCFNTSLVTNAFFVDPNKYKENVFVYAGGLAVWQCFDETLDIYKRFEDLNIPGTSLIVLTKDQETARKKIKERNIKNFEINFVKPAELPLFLSKAKFGFVIREDDPVNRVSTPTKISSYLSCGLIPIFGSCILSFKEKSKNIKYAVSWDNDDDSFNKVVSLMKEEINAKDVHKEYSGIFNEYFSNEYHINKIKDIFKEMNQ